MATETLHFENARLAQQLFNNDPHNLQVLNEELSVKAIARENWIKLEGEQEAIERAKQMFHLLESSVKGGTPVRNREFTQALSVVKNEGVSTLRNIISDRIQTSPRKSPVVPKTVGQKKYIDAIRSHDVTFGIGPAGTGKTYLAMAMAISALERRESCPHYFDPPGSRGGRSAGFPCPATFTKKSPLTCGRCTMPCTT